MNYALIAGIALLLLTASGALAISYGRQSTAAWIYRVATVYGSALAVVAGVRGRPELLVLYLLAAGTFLGLAMTPRRRKTRSV